MVLVYPCHITLCKHELNLRWLDVYVLVFRLVNFHGPLGLLDLYVICKNRFPLKAARGREGCCTHIFVMIPHVEI